MKASFFLFLAISIALQAQELPSPQLEPMPILSPPFQRFHEAPYKAGWDIHMSPYAGGENLLFLHRSLERAEDYLPDKRNFRYSTKLFAMFYRLLELLAIWSPLNDLAVVTQHEVFGHGYRIRDINRGRAKVVGYSIDAPFPYGNGGGSTSYNISDEFTTTEQTAVAMAGVESTAILAQLTRLKWLEVKHVDPRQVFLYLFSEYDLPIYTGTIQELGEMEGHDITGYIRSVNYTYPAKLLSASRLSALSWINLADPFTWYALYALGSYIAFGQEAKIPMIPIKSFGYLPSARMGLTPFGPEFFFENFLLKDKNPTYFYLKGGSHWKNLYLGAGFFAPKIWQIRGWSLGMRGDFWRQPKLLLQPGNVLITDINFQEPPDKNDPLYPYALQKKVRFGGAASILIAYQSEARSGFELELGYKSQGFLPGYSLRASPTSRLFYTLVF